MPESLDRLKRNEVFFLGAGVNLFLKMTTQTDDRQRRESNFRHLGAFDLAKLIFLGEITTEELDYICEMLLQRVEDYKRGIPTVHSSSPDYTATPDTMNSKPFRLYLDY